MVTILVMASTTSPPWILTAFRKELIMFLFEIGSIYNIVHSRKGNFEAKVLGQDSEWMTVEVTHGKAKAMMSYNVAEVGDEVTIRKSHIVSVVKVG